MNISISESGSIEPDHLVVGGFTVISLIYSIWGI